jgi:hypothetical protein
MVDIVALSESPLDARKVGIAADLVHAKVRAARAAAHGDAVRAAHLIWAWARQDTTFRDAIIRSFAAAQIAPGDGSGAIVSAVLPPSALAGFPFRPGQAGSGGSGPQAAGASGSGAGRQHLCGNHASA